MEAKMATFMEEFTALSKKYDIWLKGSDCCGCSYASFKSESSVSINVSYDEDKKSYNWIDNSE